MCDSKRPVWGIKMYKKMNKELQQKIMSLF